MCLWHILFVLRSIGHPQGSSGIPPLDVGGSYLLAVAQNAEMNMAIQASTLVSACSSFGHVLRSGISGSYGKCLIF